MRIETVRLVLRACTLDVAEALISDRRSAELLLGAGLPADWPDDELLGFLPVYAQHLRDDPAELGYGIWLVIQRDKRMVVGSAGFQGRPDVASTIEAGYGIAPEARNRGFATEAVRALIRWGLAQPGVDRISASCDRANRPSIRVLEKCGLQVAHEVDGLMDWSTPLSAGR